MKKVRTLALWLGLITAGFLTFHAAQAAYNTGGNGGGTGTSTDQQLLQNDSNTVGGITIGNGLNVTTSGGIKYLNSTGSSGLPGIIEENGPQITTENGVNIIEE